MGVKIEIFRVSNKRMNTTSDVVVFPGLNRHVFYNSTADY